MANLTIELSNLSSSIYNLNNILLDYDRWNDEVSRSYERYVGSIQTIVSNLEFTLSAIEGAINNLNAINVNRHKSELSEYSSKLRRL